MNLNLKIFQEYENFFKKATFQVSIASVPEIISTMNSNLMLDTKKNNEGLHVFLTVVKFASHKL
jgi:hypothetical protein